MPDDIKQSADVQNQLDDAAAAVVNSLKDDGSEPAQPTQSAAQPPAGPEGGQPQEPPVEGTGGEVEGAGGQDQEPFDWFQVMTGGFGTAPVPPPVPPETPQPPFQTPQAPQQPQQPGQQPGQQPTGDDWNEFLSAQSPRQYIEQAIQQVIPQVMQQVLPNMVPQVSMAVQHQIANQAALAQMAQRYGERFQLLRDFAARRLQSAPHQYMPLASNPPALYAKLFEDAEKDAIAQARMLYELQQRSSGAAASAAVSTPGKREPRATPGASRGVSEEVKAKYNKAIEEGDIDTAIEMLLRHDGLAPAKG